MKLLVTAGNTQTPLDRVRCITNVFSGKTGTSIALEAANRGHDVTLVTSHPELAAGREVCHTAAWRVIPYRTFDDLHLLMAEMVTQGQFEAIVHCAAVSDYRLDGVFSPSDRGDELVDATAGKIKSQHRELWLKLVPTPKLVDKIRAPWGFRGILTKFKLEVDVTDKEQVEIADASRRSSDADLIVANTLDGMNSLAFLGRRDGHFERLERAALSSRLLDEVQRLVLDQLPLKRRSHPGLPSIEPSQIPFQIASALA